MESRVPKQLFVYSSLRKGFHQHTLDYISHYFSFVCPAKVKGRVSNVNGELYATASHGESFIPGELFKLDDDHDFSYVFGQLDDYEGLIVEQGEQPLYRRELVKVYIDGEPDTNAWIYWYNGEVHDKPTVAARNVGEYPT